MAYKYDKEKISSIAADIMNALSEHEKSSDACVYFNGERWSCDSNQTEWHKDTEEPYYHSQDYCEYAGEEQIIVITSEGPLYDYLYDYDCPSWFDKILKENNLYMEHITGWMYALVPEGEWDEWETYKCPNPYIEPEYVCREENCPDEIILAIREFWRALIAAGQDEGCCVIGAGMNFTYNEHKYKMSPPSCYQGSMSWEKHVDIIKKMLEHVGATEIRFDYGVMD